MSRYFTLEQAQRLIPEVERLLREGLFLKAELEETSRALDEAKRRAMLYGGIQIDHARLERFARQRIESGRRLEAVLDEIRELGAQVKDLDIGLIDFPSLYQDREVCLCWRLGEDQIEWWHGLDEGFRGRKPVDDDFRANHRGSPIA